jgi:hypothetical protein
MKKKATRTAILAVAGALILSLVSGCAWSIGGKKEGGLSAHPTRGQELIDLKKARDQGAITEDEYQAHKTRIMER